MLTIAGCHDGTEYRHNGPESMPAAGNACWTASYVSWLRKVAS